MQQPEQENAIPELADFDAAGFSERLLDAMIAGQNHNEAEVAQAKAELRKEVARLQDEIDRQMEEWEPPKFIKRCSFCDLSESEVPRIISGPSCFICSECVGLCVEILDEETEAARRTTRVKCFAENLRKGGNAAA